MPSFRANGRLDGWLRSLEFPKDLHSTSHCLLHPTDSAGIPSSFVWEGNQSFRAGGTMGGPGRQV
eukprot:1148379-Pelagomonas_calceolata.AAC.1